MSHLGHGSDRVRDLLDTPANSMQSEAYWFGSFSSRGRTTDPAEGCGRSEGKISLSASRRSFADPGESKDARNVR